MCPGGSIRSRVRSTRCWSRIRRRHGSSAIPPAAFWPDSSKSTVRRSCRIRQFVITLGSVEPRLMSRPAAASRCSSPGTCSGRGGRGELRRGPCRAERGENEVPHVHLPAIAFGQSNPPDLPDPGPGSRPRRAHRGLQSSGRHPHQTHPLRQSHQRGHRCGVRAGPAPPRERLVGAVPFVLRLRSLLLPAWHRRGP